MIIDGLKGDLLDDPAPVLVNTINCVGVMGAGLALQFRHRYPQMYEEYKQRCSAGLVRIGWMDVHTTADKTIINFPTKKHWRDPSELSYIQDGLVALSQWLRQHKPPAIAVVHLGCGLGGLSRTTVHPLMVAHLDIPDTTVRIYT